MKTTDDSYSFRFQATFSNILALIWFPNNVPALWEEFLMYLACNTQDPNFNLLISEVPETF